MAKKPKTDPGQLRRMDSYLKRQEQELGRKPRQIMASEDEMVRIRAIVACWRGDDCALTEEERGAALSLKPE